VGFEWVKLDEAAKVGERKLRTLLGA
jgi:hypothetical protein